MIRHLHIALLRIGNAILIAPTLMLSHSWFGGSPEAAGVEGPSAFAFLILFFMIGIGLAALYTIVSTIVHVLCRRRLRIFMATDLSLGGTLFVLSVVMGMTARYA